MNNLIEFFKKAFHIIVLAVLLIMSIVMLGKSLSFNDYQLSRAVQSIVGPIQKSGAGMVHRFRLGPENEALVQRSVAKLVQGKTLLVIAHRLSTISSADQIILINNGRVEAAGKQKELLESSDLYRSMWQAHIAAKEDEDNA